MEELEGIVEEIIFRNDDNGYDDGTANQVLDMVMYPSVAILHALRYGDLEWIFGVCLIGNP